MLLMALEKQDVQLFFQQIDRLLINNIGQYDD